MAASATTKARAVGYLELDIKGFTAGITAAQNQLKKFGTVVKAALAAVGVGLSVKWVKDGLSDAIAFGDEMERLHEEMDGMDAGNAFLLKQAFREAGEEAGTMAEMMKKAAAYHMDPRSFFRYSFAGGGLEMGIAKAAQYHKGVAEILSRNARIFSGVADRLRDVKDKMRDFFLGLADKVIGPLNVLVNTLARFDAVAWGRKIGEALKPVLEVITGLFRSETPLQDLGAIFKNAALILWDGIVRAFKTGAEYVATAISNAMEALAAKIAGAFNLPYTPEYKKPKEIPLSADEMKHAFDLVAIIGKLQALGKKAGAGAIEERPELIPAAKAAFEPFKVIGDSMAAMGGGGLSMRTSLSFQEKDQLDRANMIRLQSEMVSGIQELIKTKQKVLEPHSK